MSRRAARRDGHGGHGHAAGRFLGTAFWVAVAILLAEVAGGLLAHSLALLSDAGHMLTDVLALALAWFAVRLARRPATPRRTFGFRRAGILTALFNASALIVVVAAILVEAVGRLRHPVPVDPGIMWAAAAAGLAGNLYLGFGLGGGHDHGDLNVRSAWLHVMGDAAASAGVLVAGVAILFTGWLWLDPLTSVAIALLIARGAWRLVCETVNVLMEGTPDGLDPGEVLAALQSDPAVLSAHHLHIWSLDGSRTALSGHLVLRDGPLSGAQDVLHRVDRALRDRFGIEHTTLQLETGADGRGCRSCEEEAPAPAETVPEAAARGVRR